ncbi:nuclear transport factor 2 family protein [Inhella gelatinilytica]|uniref:Nuclear transport factor 2 family protein n=1 Tax=Inhella gelatinilytica TaxID=2795030 RepID=A0A931IUX5_9BURK|nr:nuclear transport factor 2 family protein [Inhella gelatinilytica]MBH9553225.1 nuclear transport factor 2 family protein [Inhella gelatinilytica]
MKVILFALEDRLAQGLDFDALLHPDFFEFGRSGRRWSRTEVMAELRGTGTAAQRADEQAVELATNCWQTSWRALGSHPAWRSSIWLHGPDGWQMRFHQATPLP